MSILTVGRMASATDDGIPRFSDNAMRVLRARYLKKDERGVCTESPADLFRRVARTMADIERHYGQKDDVRSEWEDKFFGMMMHGEFLPNSPTLMNAGREMGMLSACFVLPVRDSIDEIFDAVKHTALIQKAGGGTGFAFDELRPTGDFIASSGGTTSGPIVGLLRQAGAAEIHMRVASPSITCPCFMGVDMASQEELIAANKTVDEIAEHIGADSLRYLSLEGLEEAIERPIEGHCTACFCGDYPLDLDEDLGRTALV